MGTTSSAIFTGSSQFSAALQQAVSQAVSTASAPMQALQTDVTNLQSQSTELGTLGTDLGSLQSAVTNLNSALGLASFTASSSTPSVASASLSGTPSAGSFSVEVDDPGAYASALGSDGLTTVADPSQSSISTAATYTLTVGDATYTITPQANTLSSLAAAINATTGANVQATLVNLGSNSSPDYRLSLQGTQLGDLPIQLSANDTASDGSTSQDPLLTAGAVGAPVTYRINGDPPSSSDPLSSTTPTITLSPGVSVTLQAAGTTTITVGRNTNAVSQALSSFVTAYNAVTAEINTNRGSGTGALQGQSILSTLSETLQQISGYSTGPSGISSLVSLGLSFDDKGVLSFNSSQFATAASGNLAQLASFLGSTTTGGFLKTANDALTSLTDPSTGLIQAANTSIQSDVTADNQSISDDQDRINTMQTNLNTQMADADAAIASMEQQYTYLSEMFAAEQSLNQNAG